MSRIRNKKICVVYFRRVRHRIFGTNEETTELPRLVCSSGTVGVRLTCGVIVFRAEVGPFETNSVYLPAVSSQIHRLGRGRRARSDSRSR